MMTNERHALKLLFESLMASDIEGPRLNRVEAALDLTAQVLGINLDVEELAKTLEGSAAEILIDKVNQSSVEGTCVVVQGEHGEEGVVVASVVPRLSNALDTALTAHMGDFILDA